LSALFEAWELARRASLTKHVRARELDDLVGTAAEHRLLGRTACGGRQMAVN
jgi:hypothetical protein